MDQTHITIPLDKTAVMYPWALTNTTLMSATLPECARLLVIARETKQNSNQQGPGLVGLYNKVKTTSTVKSGMQRAIRFKRLLDHFKLAPWANTRFKPNDLMIERLTATHLRVIVGNQAYKDEKEAILTTLDSTPNGEMHNTSNILWITSRQNGKTTTLGLFAAAVISLAQIGGELLNVYSTNLDRAMQVTLTNAFLNLIQVLVFTYLTNVFSNLIKVVVCTYPNLSDALF